MGQWVRQAPRTTNEMAPSYSGFRLALAILMTFPTQEDKMAITESRDAT
jgi:hypothetical protein